jgi:error-prone DNA polymerase
VLGLRALSAINDACDIVEQQTDQRPDLSALRFADRKVYDLICSGRVLGIFQVESRAQASLIPRFQPRNLSDLTIEIALIRPGPVQGNMVHPFLNRRDGLEPVRYLHPSLEPALKETLGVVLFQEQCLKVAHDFAGFTHGEGELLRRALGHKRADELIESFRDRFLQGAQMKGVSRSIAEQVFQQLKAFGGYSFAKSHAAAFAVIVYWSAWLKCYYPTAFYVGLLRNEPMGFYPRHVVVSDAIRYGLKVLPVDLRYSQAAATAEGQAIRLGLIDVKGFGPAQIETIEVERQRGPFRSLADLVRRTQLDRPHVEALVLAGALDHFGERRQLLWDLAEAYRLAKRPRELPLHSPDERAQLPPMDRTERLVTAYAATGVSLDAHLTELRRDAFTQAGATPIASLAQVKHGQRVKIGGLLVALQRPPTAKGFAFLAIEDPTGMVNAVLAPDVYAQYRSVLQGAFVLIEGVVQKDHGAINVVARQIEAI